MGKESALQSQGSWKHARQTPLLYWWQPYRARMAGGWFRFHPDKVTLVFLNKLVKKFLYWRVTHVAVIDNNAVHVFREAHRTMDLDLGGGLHHYVHATFKSKSWHHLPHPQKTAPLCTAVHPIVHIKTWKCAYTYLLVHGYHVRPQVCLLSCSNIQNLTI